MHDYTVRLLTEDRLDQFEREAAASRLASEARRTRAPLNLQRAMRVLEPFRRWLHLAPPAKPSTENSP